MGGTSEAAELTTESKASPPPRDGEGAISKAASKAAKAEAVPTVAAAKAETASKPAAKAEATPEAAPVPKGSISGGKEPAKADAGKAVSSSTKADGTKSSTATPAASTNSKSASLPASAPAAMKPPAKGASEGLADEVLTQVAQAKYEGQEDKLRDVARHSMALLRDYPKLSSAESTRKIAEIRKALLKYEMQYIRAWEFQEKRRLIEIEALAVEAQRYREEAEREGAKIAELRQVVETERRRRKRYEGYEQIAADVNTKKTRAYSKVAIDATIAEIERLGMKERELEALTELRNQRAQLLLHAVAELRTDLQGERDLRVGILGEDEANAVAAAASPSPNAEQVEVIS